MKSSTTKRSPGWRSKLLFISILFAISLLRSGLFYILTQTIPLESDYKRAQYLFLIPWTTLLISYDGRKSTASLLLNFLQVAPTIALAIFLYPEFWLMILLVNCSVLFAVNFTMTEPSIHRSWLYSQLRQ